MNFKTVRINDRQIILASQVIDDVKHINCKLSAKFKIKSWNELGEVAFDFTVRITSI